MEAALTQADRQTDRQKSGILPECRSSLLVMEVLGRMGQDLGLKERSRAAASARASKVDAAWAPRRQQSHFSVTVMQLMRVVTETGRLLKTPFRNRAAKRTGLRLFPSFNITTGNRTVAGNLLVDWSTSVFRWIPIPP